VLTKIERAARDQRIRARRRDNWTLERIARGEGLSHQRVSQIVADIPGSRQKPRRCVCGKSIERNSVTGLCRACLLDSGFKAIPQKWTPEAISEALRRFHDRYGHSPRAFDLSPAQARRVGHPEAAERFYQDGDMPSLQVVTRRFGGLNQALSAAGLPTRRPGERMT